MFGAGTNRGAQPNGVVDAADPGEATATSEPGTTTPAGIGVVPHGRGGRPRPIDDVVIAGRETVVASLGTANENDRRQPTRPGRLRTSGIGV